MSLPYPKPRVRDPDGTRQKILAAAFEEIYRHGFQAASLDTIVERAGVTKGALYHHFVDKAALGRAVVDEVIRPPVLDVYIGRLRTAGADPLTALIQVVRLLFGAAWIAMGVALEFAQAATGYRSFELSDMAANSLGVLLGWGISATLRR